MYSIHPKTIDNNKHSWYRMFFVIVFRTVVQFIPMAIALLELQKLM